MVRSAPRDVAHGGDIARVRQALLAAAGRPGILREPAPTVLVHGFGDSSSKMELAVGTSGTVQAPLRFGSGLISAIDLAFRRHGVQIPFPQRELHLRELHCESS